MILWKTTYRCSNPRCKNVIELDCFDGEKPQLAINCAVCGHGRGLEVHDMLDRRVGMFATGPAVKWDTKGELPATSKVVSIAGSR